MNTFIDNRNEATDVVESIKIDTKMGLKLINRSLAKNTLIAYAKQLRIIDEYARGEELTDELLATYLGSIANRGKGKSSAVQACAAVNWRAQAQGVQTPIGRLTRMALAGLRRTLAGEKPRRQVASIGFEQVDIMISQALAENTHRGMRDAAILAVMSDAMLRVSECVSLEVRDIDAERNILTIRQSKTDQTGIGAKLFISNRTIALIDKWQQIAKISEGILFHAVNRGDNIQITQNKPMATFSIRQMIKTRAEAIGIIGASGHSIRRGSANSLIKRGASLLEIMRIGRWGDPKMPIVYGWEIDPKKDIMNRLRYNTD